MKNKAGYGFKRALLSCMLVIVFALPWHASSQQLPPGQFPFFKSFLDGEMSYVERPTPNAPTQYVIPFDP